MPQQIWTHPYMPNSAPENLKEMLDTLGIARMEELYENLIPEELRFHGELDLPQPLESEWELKEHVGGLLKKNIPCSRYTSFLGAGCYRHYVPALCDEIANRAEFLTAYCGDTYSDHGKMQAIFEYTSMMGELLDADVVSYPCYDGAQAVCSALRMALRLGQQEERDQLLVPDTMNPEIYSQLKEYTYGIAQLVRIPHDGTGGMDLQALEGALSPRTAAVFLENPSYLGGLQVNAAQIGRMAHGAGALFVVMPEVSSLGILEAPSAYGADITCGEIQPLGVHMQYGGGCAGFLAVAQEERLFQQIPTYLYGLCPTQNPGQFGWGRALNERCSHGSREKANEYFGTESGLWAIVAGVYLASLGPQGMRELGEHILQKTHYAIKVLSQVEGLQVNPFGGTPYQEFVVCFGPGGKTVAQVNRALLDYGIFGGKDLSKDFPELGQSALYCFSEITPASEIRRLAGALQEILGGGSHA